MENIKLSKLSSKHHHHLPQDLWPEILSKLPFKSLVRFRCVSKSWMSLISDPGFHRLHLKNFKNNVDETHLLAVEGKQQSCIVRCSKTLETKSAKLLTLGEKYVNARWCYKFSVDGLVLLASPRSGHRGLTNLRLWNPSIRKFLIFPPVPEIKTAPIFYMDAEIGLGYDDDLLVKNYKHVKLMFKDANTLLSIAVYTLGARSWKIIKGASNWQWDINYRHVKSIDLHGCLYFIAWNRVTQVSELVSFDISSKAFCSTSLPDVVATRRNFYNGSGLLRLVDDGCSLAVCDVRDFRRVESKSMWVLESAKDKNKSMTWTKRYSFDLMAPKFLHLKKNGNVLHLRFAPRKNSVLEWDLVSYNLQTRKVFKLCGYIESFALL